MPVQVWRVIGDARKHFRLVVPHQRRQHDHQDEIGVKNHFHLGVLFSYLLAAHIVISIPDDRQENEQVTQCIARAQIHFRISSVEQSNTPMIAIAKLIQRIVFIFSFSRKNANTAVITGNAKTSIAALLASEYWVPYVIKYLRRKSSQSTSCTKIKTSLIFFFPFLKSLITNGARKIVASNIGNHTVK
jgi:hypothetical protein